METSKPIDGHENVGTIHNIELAHNVETIKFVNKSYIPCSNPIYASAANQLAFFCGRFDSIGRWWRCPCSYCNYIGTPLRAATSWPKLFTALRI